MSDAYPPRPDPRYWPVPPPSPVPAPEPSPSPSWRVPAITAAAFLLAGTLFVVGLPVVGRVRVVGPERPGQKVDRAVFPEPATSPRLTLQVNFVGRYSDCTTHTSGTKGLYLSNCADWESAGYHVEIFLLGLVNNTDQPVPWALDQFLVRSGSGRGVGPLPPSSSTALPASGTLAPHDFTEGYVAFNTGDDYVPKVVVYLDVDELDVDVSAP